MRNEMVMKNEGLVKHLALMAWHTIHTLRVTLQFDDVLQESYLGMMEAVEKYDETRGGANFACLAAICIRQRLLDAAKEGGVVRVPAWTLSDATRRNRPEVYERALKIQGVRRMGLMKRQDAEPDPVELAATREVSGLLRYLPPAERQVVELFFMRDMNLIEIGEQMGFSKQRAGFLKKRALQHLRQLLS